MDNADWFVRREQTSWYLVNTNMFSFFSFLCFVLLISPCFSSSFEHHLCSPSEASALLHFKQSFQNISDIDQYFSSCDGAAFPKMTSWNESRDCCTWDGVTCDMLTGHVISLELSCSLLSGSIHPNSSLFQLRHLQTLNLAYNEVNNSSIPNDIGRLTNLRHLNLSSCFFSGKIPIEISYLSSLVSLDLSYVDGLQLDQRTFETMLQNFTNLEVLSLLYVNISSPIPMNISSSSLRYVNLEYTNLRGVLTSKVFLLPNLQNLKLSYNPLLKGVLPKLHPSNTLLELGISFAGISAELSDLIGTFSSLNILNLQGCQLSGSIPDSIGNLTQLTELDLAANSFTGHIPDSVGYLTQLTELDLSRNSFTGHIPDSVGHLTQLRVLYLYSNTFTGQIPSSILSLTHLEYLDLGYNSLSGPLPSNASMLQKLKFVSFSENSLNGTIPSWVFSLPLLYELQLDQNRFSGLPDEIKTNTALENLDLSYNSLNGTIPSWVFSLPLLYQLWLDQNRFSGLPDEIKTNTALEYLDLSYNSLNGTIPSWVFSLPLLSMLSLDHNRFSGPPDEIKTNTTLEYLYLSHNQFNGSFPQLLANLTNLSTLDISSNNITGDGGTFPRLRNLLLSSCNLKDFPHFLRNVKTLEMLDISNNKIRGQIPKWFSGMRWDSLRFLNLSHNSLTGHLPQFHYYNLGYLNLKYNSLQGPLYSSICNMSSLSILDLSHNNFSDSVPHCLGSMVWLSVLDLRRNNFSGSLPPFCAHGASLSTIFVNGNQFEGTVPMSLLNCDYLEILDVGNNAINDTFPSWLGMLQRLQVLILKSNRFHGPISTRKKFYFPRLRIFDLSCNEFSGSLPAEVFNNFKAMIKLDDGDKGEIQYMERRSGFPMYEYSVSLVIKGQDIELEKINTIMTSIDLSSNHFEGVIPKALMDLSSLWLLNLSHNNLEDDIPMEMGQLNMLESLDLSWNQLTGKIPQELTRLTFLEKLNLCHNLLVGPIPQGPQFNTFENVSYGGNLDLCGPPLSKQCGTSDPSHVPQPLESDEEDDESFFFSGFTWESVVIGYSFGLVVGTVMWSLMFKYRKPKWLVEFFEGIFPMKMRRPQKRAWRRHT